MSSLRSKICRDIDGLLPIIATMLIDSQPPAIIASDSPTRMRSAAIANAVRPDAQKRFTVTPPTVFGRPDSSAPMRATFKPCSASGIAQPMMASSITLVSRPGTCATADLIACTSSSSWRVFLNMPRGALPIGVRLAATMYASCNCLLMCCSLVPHRLAGLQHAHDPLLRLGGAEQLDERTTFEREQPVFIDETS